LVKTATGRSVAVAVAVAVAVVKIGITEDLGCGSGYERITATTTNCTPLQSGVCFPISHIIGQILLYDPLPTIKAFSLVLQEERQRILSVSVSLCSLNESSALLSRAPTSVSNRNFK